MGDMIRNINYTITTGRVGTSGAIVKQPQESTVAPNMSFGDLLNQKLNSQGLNESSDLVFSKHAKVRTSERNIQLDNSDMERLNSAVGKAEAKGLGDTLILMNNNAFIVNVPNKVVVTVMDGEDAKENVFTNIDGAVIA